MHDRRLQETVVEYLWHIDLYMYVVSGVKPAVTTHYN